MDYKKAFDVGTRELFADSKGIESAEYDNNEIITKDYLVLCKYQKFKI